MHVDDGGHQGSGLRSKTRTLFLCSIFFGFLELSFFLEKQFFDNAAFYGIGDDFEHFPIVLNVLPPDKAFEGLDAFGGVERRFQVRGAERGITVVDDYGHHPTEIRATLAAAAACDYRRVIAVFQPHRYSRTAALLEEFARCFAGCDHLFVMDIYAASEPPIEGITSALLTDRIRAAGLTSAEYQPDTNDLLQRLEAVTQPGDLVLTLGA